MKPDPRPTVEALAKLGFIVIKRSVAVARRYWSVILTAAVVILFIYSGNSWYEDQSRQLIVFFVGPQGGSSEGPAREIARAIEVESSGRYAVKLVPTDGFEENRIAVSDDPVGSTIGFAHDGFGPSKNVRILLPLQSSYMHVLCRRDFLKELASDERIALPGSDSGETIRLREIAPHLDAGRVYLGPLQSGTRQVSTLLLRNLRRQPELLSTNGIGRDWLH